LPARALQHHFDQLRSLLRSDRAFAAPTHFANLPEDGPFWTLAVDVCDRLYTVRYGAGGVWRLEPDGDSWTEVVRVQSATHTFSSVRFGGGIGGWERDTLYVTDRSQLYAIPIGVNGVAAVAPPY